MKFQSLIKTENYLLLRYDTTYKMSWQRVLDIMQVFLDDIAPNIHSAAYLTIAGAEPTYISTITDGFLHETEELMNEKGAIMLSGKSKLYNENITMIAYNQLRIVQVKISLTDTKLVEEIEKDNHLLDVYMNSLEINGCVRDAQRYAINLFGKFLASQDEKAAKSFKDLCINLNATPFPENN